MKALKKLGVRFRPESFDGNKHVDIAIKSSHMHIEVDGRHHVTSSKQILSDLKRSHESHERGYDTVHITNHDVYENVEAIADALAKASEKREKEIKIKA